MSLINRERRIIFCGNFQSSVQIFQAKRIEIESGKCKPRESKTRKRGQSLSAMVAALKEPPENSEDEIEDNMDTDGDGPLFDLFDQLYNAPNSSGISMVLCLIQCE